MNLIPLPEQSIESFKQFKQMSKTFSRIVPIFLRSIPRNDPDFVIVVISVFHASLTGEISLSHEIRKKPGAGCQQV